ncbi:KAP family P-loop NTPase fold protein [Vibrio splendidus]|uniref:KAP family P-loop NTPase fold protein n=1 Tax=Vibrio splendidus TaxID=29497 RepID=UPI0013000359|nr:P-loop NTPase fold protein [Vibrio splendidus]
MLFSEPKYKNWLQEANFENCKLKRKEFGEFLASYLVGENDGFVLNLNGAWGTGKTEFCKRLYSHLITQNHPTIYINSWESDFSKEPLTVVSSELLRQMEKLHSDIIGLDETTKIKEVLGKTLKSLAVGIAGGVSYKLIGESSAGTAVMQQLVGQDADPKTFIDNLASNYSEQVDSIALIRESLTDLAVALENDISATLPVVVIVDELDRCRPSYAIEMLEVIKHFFTTEKFVFIVATDTQQLCQSIKNIYGNDFDSNQYLKRFIDRSATLPLPDISEYIKTIEFDCSGFDVLSVYPIVTGNLQNNIIMVLSALSNAFDLKVRDVDQLLNKVLSCLRAAVSYKNTSNKDQAINLPVLICGLIEYEKNLSSYSDRTSRRESRPKLVNEQVAFDENISISLLLNICLYGITEQEELVHSHMGESLHYALPRGSLMSGDNWETEGVNVSARHICNRISNINSQAFTGQNNMKIWMWPDYKKVIELAGYLD